MLYLLDKDTKTVKWNGIPLHEASSAVVKEETNGDFYLTVNYPITDSGIYQLIKEDMLIKAPVPVLGAQLFRIKKPVENDDSLDITAYHITDDVMKRSITPVSVVGQGCAMALSQMVQNAKTGLGDFSFTSDIMDSRTYNTTETETLYSVLLDGKHSIVGTWEGELVRDNFALSIKRSRCTDRGVVITTHKNLKSYQRTKNSQNVVTRIHAKSTFKAENAETDTVLTVTVDSPLIGNYPYINEKEYENNDAKTSDELKKWAEAKFTNEGIDKVSDAIEIEAYELDGQVVNLGDIVNIKSRKHDVDLYKKAIAYEYNALTEEYISITFDDKPGVGGSGVSSGVSNAADVILSANRNAQEVAIEQAVKNANQAFDAEFEKQKTNLLDNIEQSKAEAELYADTIKQNIDADVNAILQSMQEQSEEHDRQVADILSNTQSIEELANQAKTDAANAIVEAIRLDTVERQATETKLATAKSQAIAEANELVETAKSLLSGQVSSVSTDLSQTKEAIKLLATRATVDALTGRISSAESSLQVQSGEIASRVKTSDFDQAKQRISTAESSITQLGNRMTTEISAVEGKIPTSIGGRNLFKGSRDFSGVWYNASNGSFFEVYKDVHIHRTKTAWVGKSQKIPVKSGEIYTFSFYAKSDSENDTIGVYFFHNNTGTPAQCLPSGKNIVISTDYRRYSVTFEIISDGIIVPRLERPNTTSYLYFGGFKLETGSISTDWAPAQEDLIAELSSVKTTITQTADSLSRTISETKALIPTSIGSRNYIRNGDFSEQLAHWQISLPDSNYNLAHSLSNKGKTGIHWYAYPMPLFGEIKQVIPVSGDAGQKVAISFLVAKDGIGGVLTVRLHFRDSSESIVRDELKQLPDNVDEAYKRYSMIFTAPVAFENLKVMFSSPEGQSTNLYLTDVQLELADIASDYHKAIEDLATVTALHAVNDTVDSHTRTIGAVGTAGSILDNVSKVTQTANGLVQEVSGANGLKTQVSTLAGSYAIKNLTKAGDVLGQINLNPDGSVRINEGLISVGTKTYIQDGVISSAKIASLDAGKIKTGTLDAARIAANSITGSHIAFDQAFFNSFMANEAYLKQVFAKNAFITSVQAVTLSASKISGGILTATNGAMEINLNAGQILHYTDQAALKRVLNGYPTQFVKFATGTVTGKGSAGVTVIGSNRYGTESPNDGGFVGIRAWNGTNIDQIDVAGDTVRLASSTFDSADGWNVVTLPDKLEIDAYNSNHRASSRVKIGDVWLWKNSTTYSSMRDTINLIIDNLKLLHDNKTTQKAYSYTTPPKV